MADEGLELGDYIVIVGGSLNKTTGKLYSYSEDRFAILPSGATDRLIKIPLIDGMPDPELGITDIKILKKAPVPGFIHLVDLRAGQMVETFLEGPERGPYFKVISVNEENDSAIFQDESGDQTEIVFGYTGIPRELGYEVIRTREIDEKPPVPEGEAQEDDIPPRTTLAIAFDEEDDEDVVPTPGEEQEEEGHKMTFEIGEDIELPELKEIEEVSSAFRVYQDVFQRSEMLGQLIRNLPIGQQRNPVKLQEIRRMVELMLIMRNDVVQYGVTGEPLGKPKATSMTTLADLVTAGSQPLVRKVANVSKVLYLDHSHQNNLNISKGKEGTDPDPGQIEDGLYGEYGADIIESADTLEKSFNVNEGGEPGVGMPKFFIHLETYRKRIQTPYKFSPGKTKQSTRDEEVFRLEIPSSTSEDANLNVLSMYPSMSKKQEAFIVNPPNIIQHPFGVARMLKPRVSRFTTGEEFRVVEQGENPNYNTVLLFPLSTLRDLGPIRSGSLAQDISLGMTEPRLLQQILDSLDDVNDQPTADGILSLGVEGETIGNIMVKDWLSSLKINIAGVGDVNYLLHGYGALSIEWNTEQMAILQGKVEQRLAALRIFLTKQREENKASLANLKFVPNPLLAPEFSARLLDRVRGEPILQKAFASLQDSMGELADIDLYWFIYLMLGYPDLLMATLGQQPAVVAKERLRKVREQYNNALNLGYRIKVKLANVGEIPVVNTCPHVEALEKARKLGHKFADEPQDKTKMKALLKVLNTFRGKIEENWVWCNRCNGHLICGHELLQIQEILRPKEKDAIQKEIVLKFSGGEFSGKFICRVCGQGIRDLDFDTSIEFDDAGRPMMGRSVLVDTDAIEEQEINALLSGPTVEEGLEFQSDDLSIMFKTIKKICSLIGVNPEDNDYKLMVNEHSNYIAGLPSREAYSAAAKGKKVQDYDIWYSIRYVSSAAAIVLINIQTHIPDYIVYYTNSNCKEGFFGYPLDKEGDAQSSTADASQAGMTCMANVIAGINDNEFPWNSTTLQLSGDLQKRKNAIFPLIKSQIDAFLKFSSIQASIDKKRDYRVKLFGSAEGVKKDTIPSHFRPVPYIINAEEAAQAPLVPDAATPEKRATAWIRMSHTMAASTAALNPDSPYSETTCCLHSINTQSSTDWNSFPKLETRISESMRTRTATVSTTFYTEKQKALEGKIDPNDYYKLFVKVCYQGDKKGLPHELGITLSCSNCELTFQENPSLITEYDPKDKEEYQLRTKAYLESQGIIINETTFNELLMTSRQKEAVSVDPVPYIANMSDIFDRLVQYPPAFDNWEPLIRKTQAALAELSEESTLSNVQVATAAEELVRYLVEKEDFVKSRLNKQVYSYLQSIVIRHPRECGESLSTYLLVPFQRWITDFSASSYKVLSSYKLSYFTAEDIMVKGLGAHLEQLGGEELVGIALIKAKEFVRDLSEMCRYIYPYIRAVRTPGGKDMIQYISRAYVFGAISKLIDPQNIPVTQDDMPEDDAINMKLIYKGLGQALTKYAVGSKIPSSDEIRISLEKRAEKEKQVYLSKLEGLSKESRQVELTLKNLGMGDWAVGGTKAIRQYDADRYEAERAERAAAGIVDYPGVADANAADAARTYDMFGTDFGDDYDAAGANGDGGYDHDQMAEDDY
jgi:hypothetical protein